MKKSFTFCLLVLIFCMNANGQMRTYKEKSSFVKLRFEKAQKLKKTTLMVAVDEEEPEYTKLLKASVEKYWTHTPFEFISNDQVPEYIKRDDCSVLAMIRRTLKYGKSETVEGYQYAIFMGGKENKTLNDAGISYSIELPDKISKKTGSQLTDFEYLIPFFIKALNRTVENDLNKVPNDTYRRKWASYSKTGIKEMPGKTVLLYEKAMDEKFNMKSFCNNFGLDPNKVKIADKSEITAAIESEDPNIAIVYCLNDYGTIFDAKTTDRLATGSGHNNTRKIVVSYSCAAIALFLFIYEAATGGL